ncbi:MAG: hypothetical protein ACJ8LI_08115 [Chthoniobacterales bacterium]
MDEFGYLSVLLSIIIGLAVTEILQGLRRRMISHVEVKMYWPTKLWLGTLLLVCTQTWWAMFGLRERHDWEFGQFMILLGQSIILYLLCGIVLPEIGGNEPIDVRAHYFRQRKRFFALLIAAAVTSVCRDWVLNHSLPDQRNLIFHGVFLAIGLGGLVIATEWFHKAIAAFTAVVFVYYITELFQRLH